VSERRRPRLVPIAWTVAAAVLVALVVAVGQHLSATSAPGGAGMHMSAADALTRGGAGTPSSPLLGAALVTAWQLDAVALAVIVLLAALYLTAVARVPGRAPGERWPWPRTASFVAGLAVCAVATNGSFAVYDQVLFSAHMLGHLALVMVAPALLMWGRPLRLALASAPPARRARLERIMTGRTVALLTAPPVALATYTAVIVGSHLTGLMDTIMRNTWAGQVEHLVYLLAGCQFFVLIVGDEPIRWRLGSPARWLLLAVAMAVDTFTGIVLMQGTSAVSMRPSALHVSALSDTRTGGAIMWFGGDGIMAAIMIVLVVGYLRAVESEPAERGWLAQARVAAFDAHTAAHPPQDGGGGAERDLDSDDAAREAYNAWLQKLNTGG
jgi:cytochrome c oxidase assembly factor CtaG